MADTGYVVVSPPLLRVLPRGLSTVVADGMPYYTANGIYYKAVPNGYAVIEKPVGLALPAQPQVAPVVETPAAQQALEVSPTAEAVAKEEEGESITLYVPAKHGNTFIPVTLRRHESGFVGPQGEFYSDMPKVSLLTEMYGHE